MPRYAPRPGAMGGRAALSQLAILERGEELEQLEAACGARGGEARLAVIEGAARIGKTRLVEAALDAASREDIAVYEPVDDDNRLAPAGTRAPKLLVTNVINRAFPLIPYELGDELTMLREPNPGPWSGRRIAEIEGRVDGAFIYRDAGARRARSGDGQAPARRLSQQP